MDKKYQTRYNADTILRDGILLKNLLNEAMKQINFIAKNIEQNRLSNIETLVARLKEIDIYRTKRYPEEETPKRIYDFVLFQAKERLPKCFYEILEEYGKIPEFAHKKPSS